MVKKDKKLKIEKGKHLKGEKLIKLVKKGKNFKKHIRNWKKSEFENGKDHDLKLVKILKKVTNLKKKVKNFERSKIVKLQKGQIKKKSKVSV